MPSEFQSNDPPHVLGIPVDVTPPPLQNSGMPPVVYGFGNFLEPPISSKKRQTLLYAHSLSLQIAIEDMNMQSLLVNTAFIYSQFSLFIFN